MSKRSAANLAAVLFFLALLGLGLAIYSSYGVSWDEPTQRDLGIKNYRYIVNADPALLTERDRWYGPFFEIFLTAFQSRGNDSQIYLSRHLINFLTFYAGCVGFYFLCRRFTRSGWFALLGTACLVLSPRIFADAFYNSKDIPFLVFYTAALLSMLWFLDHPGPLRALVHAMLSAAQLAIRLPGVMIPALTLLGLVIEVACKRISWKQAGINALLYLGMTSGACVLLWPALWPDPLNGFAEAFRFMSRFSHETVTLYLGQRISSLALPWHYIPVWMAVTTPPAYLAGFACGLVAVVWRVGKALKKGFLPQHRDELLALGALLGPLLAVIAMRSVLYDGWRQMFFIYPAFLLVAVMGTQAVWASLRARIPQKPVLAVGGLILAIGLLPTAGWMVVSQPYQNVYFNRLAGADLQTAQQRFMMDYWGLAYRGGIEAVLEADSSAQVTIYMETTAGERAIAILAPDEARRVHVVHELSEADYFIGNYYLTTGDYPFKDEIFTIRVGNARILSVFRLSADEKSDLTPGGLMNPL